MRCSLFLLVIISTYVAAEPWLGSRFSQNCAGCHAPSRKNLKAIERRCTLSCQGCHVNPNGGGMRSFYGRWTQNRWLRSYRVLSLTETKTVLPADRQNYIKEPFQKGPGNKWIYSEGVTLQESEKDYLGEARFNNKEDQSWKKTAETRKEFLYNVPLHDPYRMFDYSRVDAGGDVRWLWRSLQSESNSSESVADSAATWQSFLMGIDVGMRYRPIHRYVHLVYEGRIMGNPSDSAQMKDTLATMGTRSLYGMVDNMPFNTFIMGGYYRPFINNMTPDHNSLNNQFLASALYGSTRHQALLFEAITVGAAPNVPFANVHYIRRKKTIGGDIDGDRTRGFAVNGGLRFVTFGLAVNSTYWRTSDVNDRTEKKTDVEIGSVSVSSQLWRFNLGVEFLSVARDVEEVDFRRGGVIAFESRTKVWRENYLVAHYASANRTLNLLPGKTSQLKVGVRGFHLAGLDTMITYDIDEETSDGEKNEQENTRRTAHVTGQIHFFF